MSNDFISGVRRLNKGLDELQGIFNKLSSGKRITKASDDAAGLAIAAQLNSDVATYSAASRNASDAQSAIQIADSALSQISDIGGRLAEISTQAANGTLSDTQRQALNQEYQALSQEITRITETTEFNGNKLLSGESISIQVGTDSGSNSQITIGGVSGVTAGGDISTQATAKAAIESINSFISNVAAERGKLGASSQRVQVAQNNIEVARENSASAASRIEDLDYASEVAKKTAKEIQTQAGPALLAQAGRLKKENVLKLLQ